MLRRATCDTAGVLIVLPIALVLVLAWIAWQSRERPYLSGTCCGNAQWPPDDLTGEDPAPASPPPPVGR